MHIDAKKVLKNRILPENLTTFQLSNLNQLIERVNALLADYPHSVEVSSGYRSAALNASLPNSGAKSWHLQCAAVDLADKPGLLQYILERLQECADIGLWLEDPRHTPTWIHLQIYPPSSGRRVFVPSSKAAIAPERWNGAYDAKLNSKVPKA
jgi:Peptidase M15